MKNEYRSIFDIRQRGARVLCAVCVVFVTACATAPRVQEDPPVWTTKFARPVQFQLLVRDDLLIVGTLRHLYGVDTSSGDVRWRKRNLAVSSDDLTLLPSDQYVLVNDAAGGAFHDRDTNILALDPESGDIVWESPMVPGRIQQGTLDPAQEVFYFTRVALPHGDDRGFLSGILGKGIGSGYEQVPVLQALDINSGKLLWTRAYKSEVRMRPTYARQLDDKDDWSHTRPFDLGLYHPPLVVGDQLCVTYLGIHCFDRHTGELLWKQRFDVIENDMALSYAFPLVDGSTIIISGANRVRAFDLKTGKNVWRSERINIASELMMDDHVVYAQLGGRFLDLDSEKWKWKGDFGVIALDRRTGKTRWEFDDADDSITNILVYGNRVWFADEDGLIGLDRRSGELRVRESHDFDSPPEFTALNERGQLVLIGEGRVSAFDIENGDAVPLWSVNHPPIGPGAWSRFAEGVRRSTGNVLKFLSFVVARAGGLLPSISLPLGSVDFTLVSTKRVVSGSLARSGRRMTYRSGAFDDGQGNASFSGNYQYFVTQPKGYDRPALAVVNISSGVTERYIRLDAERPSLVIDETSESIFQAAKRQLVALPLNSRSAASRKMSAN